MAAKIYKQSAMHEAGIKKWTTELLKPINDFIANIKDWTKTLCEEKQQETIEHIDEKLRERDALLDERIERQVQAQLDRVMSATNNAGKPRGIAKKKSQTMPARKTANVAARNHPRKAAESAAGASTPRVAAQSAAPIGPVTEFTRLTRSRLDLRDKDLKYTTKKGNEMHLKTREPLC